MGKVLGLIGCGKWGRNILRDLLTLGCDVLVADPSAPAREYALKAGAGAVMEESSSLSALGCDGYIVASPILTLVDEAQKMLHTGKPVFCEKPVFLTTEDRERLLKAGAKERLYAMYKFFYHPGVEALTALLKSLEMGNLEQAVIQRHGWDDDFQGTNCLWLVSGHLFSIAYRLLGCLPQVKRADITCEAGIVTKALITLGNETPVTIDVSSRQPQKSFYINLFFSNGEALLAGAYAENIVIKKRGVESLLPIAGGMPLLLELKDFINHLHGGPAPRCNFEMADAINKAIRAVESARNETALSPIP